MLNISLTIPQKAEAAKSGAAKSRHIQKFLGIISSQFDLYMGLYIAKEDRLMKENLDKFIAEETWLVDEGEGNKVQTICGSIEFGDKSDFIWREIIIPYYVYSVEFFECQQVFL